MDRRTLTMNWEGLVDDDDDDRFFESYERISSAVPLDLSSGSDDDDGDFEDSRMSFVSTISSASSKSVHPLGPVPKPSSILEGYGMWMAEPGDLKERRKRLLHGMGLSSNKDLLKLASRKIARAITRKINAGNVVTSEVKSSPLEEPKREVSLPPVSVVLVRSRSEGDIEPLSVHPMAGIASERPPLAEITPMPSEKRKKGKTNKKKGNTIPDYVNVPETVFSLSEKPVCTFNGHQDDVLDLSWSRSQLLLSSSMDKTVRMWDLESKSCLKMFAHNDYVTCIQFHPVDDDYFISGSLDAKIRIWNIPDRQVVDWTDVNEMVTAACYTPDGQGKNSSSQISASFSPDGKHVISASEDSQVYIWKLDESKNLGGGKGRRVTIHAHEHFPCKDVSVAIPWPGSIKNEPPNVEIHSKRHSKRLTAPLPPSASNSPTRDDKLVGASSRRHLPPLPKKNNGLERITSHVDEDLDHSGRIDPGIGVSDSFSSSSQSLAYGDSPSISASGTSPSQSWSSSWSLFDGSSGQGGQTVQATAWGLVIVTASLGGKIRVYQNFGLPLKVSRQALLFRDH